jgi:hypothetical protein
LEELTEVLPEAAQWEDLRQAWDDVLREKDPPGISTSDDNVGWLLGRLDLLIELGYATSSTVEDFVADVMEWRLDWPEPDPAFKQLDEILLRHGAQISVDYE